MKVIVSATYEEMCQKAARLIAAEMTMKPDAVLGLATGSTPVGIYKELVQEYKADQLDFGETVTINLDEYVGLAPDHPQSYRYFMEENLFQQVNILPENTHVLSGIAANPEEECEAFEQLIEEAGGIDIQLLGLGQNGHIAFNEPEDFFPDHTHMVTLTQNTIEANSRFFDSEEQVPTQALTMGVGTIMRARHIVLAASGEAKAQAVYDMLFGPVTPKVPASILRFHPDVTVLVDAEAFRLAAERR